MNIPSPTFQFEQPLWDSGKQFIAGVDEVGRGCFAGPVVAAAVILPANFDQTLGVHDSKLLKPELREKLAVIIKEQALAYSIAEISVSMINEIGIGKATQLAFAKAVVALRQVPDHILIDAFFIDAIEKTKQTPIIKGDQKSISIAAASIIAKVYRDALMSKLELAYGKWGFGKNKGYGTKEHRDAIKQFGLSDLHRTSFDLSKFL